MFRNHHRFQLKFWGLVFGKLIFSIAKLPNMNFLSKTHSTDGRASMFPGKFFPAYKLLREIPVHKAIPICPNCSKICKLFHKKDICTHMLNVVEWNASDRIEIPILDGDIRRLLGNTKSLYPCPIESMPSVHVLHHDYIVSVCRHLWGQFIPRFWSKHKITHRYRLALDLLLLD